MMNVYTEEASARISVDDNLSDDDFEFSSIARGVQASIVSNEGFEDRLIYPLFDRSLLLDDDNNTVEAAEDKEVGMLSSRDDMDVVAAGQYCEWTPRSAPSSPGRCKKSSSTGSLSRRWRLRDMLVGRSRSDGKEKFELMAPADKKRSSNVETAHKMTGTVGEKSKEEAKGRKVTEVSMASLHRLYYGKAAGGGGGGCAPRPSRPHKQDYIGLLGLGRKEKISTDQLRLIV